MSYVLGWTAYYSDGSEHSSLTTHPTALPPAGLQIWMLYFRDGTRRVLSGNDYFFWQDNGSDDGIFAQTDDPPSEILARYPNAYIISGELVSDEFFRNLTQAAYARKQP